MVVGIVAYFFQVVVLARYAEAFLGIGNALKLNGFVAQKQVLKRRHARVNEHQCRVVFHHDGRRRHDLVLFGGKEIEELFADFA